MRFGCPMYRDTIMLVGKSSRSQKVFCGVSDFATGEKDRFNLVTDKGWMTPVRKYAVDFYDDNMTALIKDSVSMMMNPFGVFFVVPESEIEKLEDLAYQSTWTRDLSRFSEQVTLSMLGYDAETVQLITSGRLAKELADYEKLKSQVASQSGINQEKISPPPMLSPKDEARKKEVDKLLQSQEEIRHTEEIQPAKRKAS